MTTLGGMLVISNCYRKPSFYYFVPRLTENPVHALLVILHANYIMAFVCIWSEVPSWYTKFFVTTLGGMLVISNCYRKLISCLENPDIDKFFFMMLFLNNQSGLCLYQEVALLNHTRQLTVKLYNEICSECLLIQRLHQFNTKDVIEKCCSFRRNAWIQLINVFVARFTNV